MSAPAEQEVGRDGQDQGPAKTDYKAQLDAAADGVRKKAAAEEEKKDHTLVDKVSEYIPAVGKLLGKEEKPKEPEVPKEIPGPPQRPHHDTQIEEFVRDAHRSKGVGEELE